MAEIAGSVIGVISLSIQLFDKVSTYANGVNDAKAKAEQISAEMDGLVELLENLETVINKVNLAQHVALTRVGISECARAIGLVRQKLGDESVTTGSKLWDRSRKMIKCLTFPFKEADIKYWKDVLSSVQQNLQTALLALQIDQQQLHFTNLETQISELSISNQAGIQKILDQQRVAQEKRSLQNRSRTQLVDINSIPTEENLESLRNIITLQEQASKLLSRALAPVSAASFEDEVTDFRIFKQNVRPTLNQLKRKSGTSSTCRCLGQHEAIYDLRRPFFLSQTRHNTHSRDCKFWLPENCTLNIRFGLIVCYLTLGLKWRMLLALSIGAGSVTAAPSLTCHRVVDEFSSPAFKIIASVCGFERPRENLRRSPSELLKVFQTGQSSPHDRLSNGQTLLHYLCNRISDFIWVMHPNELDDYRYLFREILSYLLLPATEQVDHTWKLLVVELLQHDLQISMRCHPDDPFESYGSWVEIPFANFPDPFFSSSEATRAIFVRSAQYLERIAHRDQIGDYLNSEDTVKLYKMATRMGWVRGCEVLFEAGLRYIPKQHKGKQREPPTLLSDAIESRSLEMVRFWLAVRDNADEEHIWYIGHPETAFVYASEIRRDRPIAEALLSHIVEQRSRIWRIVRTHGIENLCTINEAAILDAHVACVLVALLDRGVDVPYSLRPPGSSVYNARVLYRDNPLIYRTSNESVHTLRMLYDAGFKVIAGQNFICKRGTTCTPLIYAITGYRRFESITPAPPTRFFEIIEWFLSKGASWNECWPGSKATALHCFATKAAIITWAKPINQFIQSNIAATFRHKLFDDCKCSCSTYGCSGITSFWKGSYRFDVGYMAKICELFKMGDGVKVEPSKIQRIGRWELEHVVRCVSESIKMDGQRWIVSEFIRLFVFSLLGIRHLCCNIDRIEHQGSPDFTRQPLPRYDPEKIQRVMEEDEHLKHLLEDIVLILDKRFNAHEGDLLAFVDEHLLPEMDVVLKQLKKKDSNLYAAGRKSIGVVMEVDHGADEYHKSRDILVDNVYGL